MSVFERRLDVLASPALARALLTVLAAIRSAVDSDAPRPFTLALMSSYCRSRLALHACCGISASRVGHGPELCILRTPRRGTETAHSGGFRADRAGHLHLMRP